MGQLCKLQVQIMAIGANKMPASRFSREMDAVGTPGCGQGIGRGEEGVRDKDS
jgi:hypothetical protein